MNIGKVESIFENDINNQTEEILLSLKNQFQISFRYSIQLSFIDLGKIDIFYYFVLWKIHIYIQGCRNNFSNSFTYFFISVYNITNYFKHRKQRNKNIKQLDKYQQISESGYLYIEPKIQFQNFGSFQITLIFVTTKHVSKNLIFEIYLGETCGKYIFLLLYSKRFLYIVALSKLMDKRPIKVCSHQYMLDKNYLHFLTLKKRIFFRQPHYKVTYRMFFFNYFRIIIVISLIINLNISVQKSIESNIIGDRSIFNKVLRSH
ncbi:unnamed protein product [Paramecium primaurelia]|uniref:Transmembrane protein n=1 Tax=Paramecium primaurelia TaxID=5886 RepID=A0A8S1QNL8_PARPR|nr:unnamed protein product [Paramecium primaurelia]